MYTEEAIFENMIKIVKRMHQDAKAQTQLERDMIDEAREAVAFAEEVQQWQLKAYSLAREKEKKVFSMIISNIMMNL